MLVLILEGGENIIRQVQFSIFFISKTDKIVFTGEDLFGGNSIQIGVDARQDALGDENSIKLDFSPSRCVLDVGVIPLVDEAEILFVVDEINPM